MLPIKILSHRYEVNKLILLSPLKLLIDLESALQPHQPKYYLIKGRLFKIGFVIISLLDKNNTKVIMMQIVKAELIAHDPDLSPSCFYNILMKVENASMHNRELQSKNKLVTIVSPD